MKRRNSAVAAMIVASGTLLSGCSSAPAVTDASGETASSSYPEFFDPCNRGMASWFATHGYHQPHYIAPVLDEIGSNCSFVSTVDGFAIMSRGSNPGDGIDRRLHHLLGKSGPVSHTSIAGYPTDIEIISADETRQECHLVMTVDYGYLEVTGGPRGSTPDSYPRDCDAARRFAELLLHRMEDVWPE